MQYTTLALSALLGAAAVVASAESQHQVASAGHLRRQNNPTSLAAAGHQLFRVLQDPADDVEDDHAHEEDEDGEHHEDEDGDEDHIEGGEMEKLPEWMTGEEGEEEEHHDDEHGEEHGEEDGDHLETETAVVEGDEDEHHDEHEEGEEEGKSKC